VLAVAFLGMFGLLAAAVLAFASTVESQRASTERTAKIDSIAEGAAQFAVADTGVQACGTVGSGTMTFPSGDTLSYSAPAGSCGSTTSSSPGQNCSLCVLNYQASSTPVSVQKGDWSAPGEIDVNGSMNVQSVSSGTRIGLHGAGASCGSSCAPSPVSLTNPVVDPLQGALPTPSPGSNPPDKSGGGIICPGSYHNVSVGNGQILFLSSYGQNGCAASSSPSLYIITGQISNTGGGSIAAGGATLYLSPTASINIQGDNSSQISIDCGATPTNASCGTANPPSSGPYAGVAVFMDPGNTSTISFQGNGNFAVAGTFEASHAILSMGGNGGAQSFQSGRLIISQIQGNGNGGAGLGFGGAVTATGCTYWNDTLTGTPANSGSSGVPPPLGAHVRFESACNSGTGASVINFAYGP